MSWIELAAQRRPQQVPQGVKPPENAADWYRIVNSADDLDETDIYVYDAIGGWFGMYADDFIRDLKDIGTRKINLRINSPGGSVFEGIAIANALRSHPASVTVYVDALAASIASVIALAGDRLVMMPQSQLMIHDASGACYGNAEDMEYMVGLLNKQSDNIADAYADRAGGTSDEWRDLMKAETWYSAKEAVAAGLADEVMPFPPKKEDEEKPAPASARMETNWDLTAYRYAGREKAPAPPTPSPFARGGLLDSIPVAATLTAAQAEAVQAKAAFEPEHITQILALMRQAIRDEIAIVEAAVSPAHSTAVKDGTWDAGANEGRLPSPVPVATAKKMYTYYDADKAEDGGIPKSACKLPHHFVSDDGTPGAASVAGVRNALARLPQTQGLSDSERTAAEAHLRKHLNAFNGDDADDTADPVDLAASPPMPCPEEPEKEEEETEAAVDPDEDVDDAKKKKLPPWLKPDEDDDEDEESEDSVDDAPPSASTTDPAEPADSWSQVIAGLIKSPSPSADDVLTRLKEGSS